MFANYIKLLFVLTAYSPILLIIAAVELYNCLSRGESVELIDNWFELFNRLNLVFAFFLLLLICYILMKIAKKKLTVNPVEIKAIKSADLNMNTLLLSYFLPCVELVKKDTVFVIGWVIVLVVLIIINKGTYFYNPILKLFGFRYYEVTTGKGVTYTAISEKKLINANEIKSYSQLTDYVILNQT
ncbi:hypothetical protein [Bacteroides sp. 214]|uniref:hypothetical protein n=1 Tax=Bacteroides sp. 214 TaxID=2302935 RepID=UPI0013CF6977|nr:hypothetical protein [Bacteroides sp. 214]